VSLFEPGLPGLICRACGAPRVWTMLSDGGQRLFTECPACSYWANEPLPPNWVIWPNPGKGWKGFFGRFGSYEAAIQAYTDTYGEPPPIQAYADVYGGDNCDDILWIVEADTRVSTRLTDRDRDIIGRARELAALATVGSSAAIREHYGLGDATPAYPHALGEVREKAGG